ncbi:hypothetical protein D3C76_1247870 [compost metagenome]
MIAADFGNVEEVDLVLGGEVHRQSTGIAQVRRPENRQHQVRAVRHAIEAQGLAEVLALVRQAHLACRVPQAGDANGGVEQQARGDFHRTLALELQQAVEQVGDIAQVAEEVAHATTDKTRGDVAVAIDHRQEHPLVKAVVEVVDPPVHRLQRVVDIQCGERRTLELTLVQARIEFEFFEWLGEAIGFDNTGTRSGFFGLGQSTGK